MSNSKERILNGVNTLANAVKITLGTKGKTVMYNKKRDFEDPKGYAVLTKDGVTVAQQVHSDDPVEDMAIQVVREAAQKTVRSSGDGTTTTTILAQAIINSGNSVMQEVGISSWEFNRHVDRVVSEIIESIRLISRPVDDDFEMIKKVATISSNDPEVGDLIYNIMKEVGIYADIEPKRTKNIYSTEVEVVKGMKLHKGYRAPFFCNDKEKMEFWARGGCYILIFDDIIRDYNDVASYIRAATDKEGNPLPILIFAEDVAATVLDRLEGMVKYNPRPIMIVEHDGFGDRRTELMNDLALITGGFIVDAQTHSTTPVKYLGWCEEAHVTQHQTCIYGGRSDEEELKLEIDAIKRKLSDPAIDRGDKKYHSKRLANMAGGLAVIRVGGKTDVEMEESYARIEDAVLAVRSSLKDGVVPGGAYTWIKVRNNVITNMEDEHPARVTVLNALMAVLDQLLTNAGLTDRKEEIVSKCIDENKAFDLVDEKFYNIEDYNVFDATSVLTDSIVNAAAVAKSILSIGAVVHDGEVK